MIKFILIFITLCFSIKSFACDFIKENTDSDKQIKQWLGNDSNFSKSYIEGKCALDKALKKLPVSEKKVIANLIAKSYGFEIKSIKKLQTYNY